MTGDSSKFAAALSPAQKVSERRALWHSLFTMLFVLSVAYLPVLLSMWETLDCDRASDVCRSSQRFLGIAVATDTFAASSLRGTRLVDWPSRERGGLRHRWDILLETIDGEHRLSIEASTAADEELRREQRAIESFISGAAPRYEHVSLFGMNLVGLVLLPVMGWVVVRVVQLIRRIQRLS